MCVIVRMCGCVCACVYECMCARVCMCELERRAATDLPVGIEVGGGDLQCDPVLRFLVHLLRDEAGLLHQQVGPNDLLAQLTQAPGQNRLPRAHTSQPRVSRRPFHWPSNLRSYL